MAWPSGMQLVNITVGSTLNFFGDEQIVKVTVTPVIGGSSTRLIWAATGQPVVLGTKEFTGLAGSIASFTIPNPDQDGFIDGAGNAARNWSYSATVVVAGQRWTQAFQPVAGQTEIDLDLVPDGAITAPTSAPTPAVTSVNGKVGAVIITGGDGGGASTWDELTDKPTEFPPADHTHPIVEVTGLQTTLDGKAATSHTHTIGNVTGLQTALDGKQASGSYATSSDLTTGLNGKANATHAHAVTDVTGLQTALDGKQASGSYALTTHTHAAANISDSTTTGRSVLTATDEAAARAAIGAGTSSVIVGTGATNAKAGNYTPPVADLPAGTTLTVVNVNGTQARPTSRTDIFVRWVGGTVQPANGLANDVWEKDVAP